MRMSDRFIVCIVAVLYATASLATRAQDALSEIDIAYGQTVTADASEEANRWHGFLGAGLIALKHPIADRQRFLLPLLSVSYRDTLYWNVGRVGAWVLKSADRRARLGLAIKARGGYDPDDFAELAGMTKRHTSAEAGLNGQWWTPSVAMSFGYFTDISDNSNGSSALLVLSHPFRLNDAWSLTPSVGAEWLSADVVDYYFGVRPSEAAPIRPVYTGQSSLNLRFALTAYYKLEGAWSLFGGASYTRLDSGIADSPISMHDNVAAIFGGGGWRFQ